MINLLTLIFKNNATEVNLTTNGVSKIKGSKQAKMVTDSILLDKNCQLFSVIFMHCYSFLTINK